MSIFKKKIVWTSGLLILVVASIYAWNYGLDSLGSSLCENQPIQSIDSPDGSKKVVMFSTDCGATSGWSVHASILDEDKEVNSESVGNAIRINSNQGRAWPKDDQGRPVIRAVWETSTSVTLKYSSNSEVFYQKSEIDGVQITIIPVTN